MILFSKYTLTWDWKEETQVQIRFREEEFTVELQLCIRHKAGHLHGPLFTPLSSP